MLGGVYCIIYVIFMKYLPIAFSHYGQEAKNNDYFNLH